MFIHANKIVINSEYIKFIDTSELISKGNIIIRYSDETILRVEGQEAFNVVMELCPSALEGHQAKYARHVWAIHNLIGHPLMQIMSWLGYPKLGVQIHDATAPFPIEVK